MHKALSLSRLTPLYVYHWETGRCRRNGEKIKKPSPEETFSSASAGDILRLESFLSPGSNSLLFLSSFFHRGYILGLRRLMVHIR